MCYDFSTKPSKYSYERHDIFSRLCFHLHRFAKYIRFGPGSGSIWMDDLNCGGNELDIADCGFSGWGSHDCSHGEDIGVSCGVYASVYVHGHIADVICSI